MRLVLQALKWNVFHFMNAFAPLAATKLPAPVGILHFLGASRLTPRKRFDGKDWVLSKLSFTFFFPPLKLLTSRVTMKEQLIKSGKIIYVTNALLQRLPHPGQQMGLFGSQGIVLGKPRCFVLQFERVTPANFQRLTCHNHSGAESTQIKPYSSNNKHFLCEAARVADSSPRQGFPQILVIFADLRVCVCRGSRWRLSGRSWWSWATAPVGRPASSSCSAKTSSPRCTFPPCLRTTWPTSRWTADRWAELHVCLDAFFGGGSLFLSLQVYIYIRKVYKKRVNIQAIGQRNSSFPQSISWESKNLLAMFEGFF